MKKIKNIITLIILLLTITMLYTIFLNMNKLKNYPIMDNIEETIRDLNIYYTDTKLPITVFKNIVSQDYIGDSEKESKLKTAYFSNYIKISTATQLAIKSVDDLEILMTKMKMPFGNNKRWQSLVKQQKALYHQYSTLNSSLLTLSNRSLPTDTNIFELEEHYYDIAETLTDFSNQYLVYYSKLRKTLIQIGSILFSFVFLIVLIITFILYKLMYHDIPFIINSFKKLGNHDYALNSNSNIKPFFDEEKVISKMVQDIFLEKQISTKFKNDVMHTYMMDEIIDKLFVRFNKLLSIQRIGIAFVDYSAEKIIAEYGVLEDQKTLLGPGFQVDIQKTSLRKQLKSRVAEINNDLIGYHEFKGKSGALELILLEGLKSNMTIPLISNDSVFGFVFISSKEKNYFTESHLKIASSMIYEISGYLNRAYLMKVILSKITNTFAELVDQKDNETGGHIKRMVQYSVILAKGLLSRQEAGYHIEKKTILEIERNASVHDIGKVGIPDAILKKPGKLTSEEWEIMKTHAAAGGDIFKSLRKNMSIFDYDFYKVAEQIARHHHERFDGNGYPDQLVGQDIPLVARIVAVADVFDALTSKRVYKDAFTFKEATNIILEGKGSQFDPVIVEVFLTAEKAFLEVYHHMNEL